MTNEEIVADKIKEYEVFKKEAEERESKSLETIEAGLPSATMDTVNMHAKINNEHIKLYKSLDPDHIQGTDKQKHGGAATASIPVVGPFIAPLASMIAYTISTSIYNSVIETIKILRSTEEIQRLFQFYKDAYENLCEQRKQLMSYLDQQTQLRKNIVMSAFTEMETSIFNNDLSKFNQNLGRVLDIYADGLLFQSKSDFDKTIRNRIPIKI